MEDHDKSREQLLEELQSLRDRLVETEQKHTENWRHERQRGQFRKMDSLRRLASYIAHDFNNMLTVIQFLSNVVLKDLPPENNSRACIEQIQKAGHRAAALTNQLLTFSSRKVRTVQELNLGDFLSDLNGNLRRMAGKEVELILFLAPDLPSVKADPNQMEQLVMNLVANARDAMPQGGKLYLETALVAAPENVGPMDRSRRPNVVLTVRDTGIGMDENTQARLFEPFFTTKEVGRGGGWGLAQVYGIVSQCEGQVSVESQPGKGTTVRVYLPAEAKPTDIVEEFSETPRGTETLLVVETEESVRRLITVALQSLGYSVVEAAHGTQALELDPRQTGPIQLLITNLNMRRMNGQQLYRQLQERWPNLKVLYVSGSSDESGNWPQDPSLAFLQKPFTLYRLGRKVRTILDPSPQPCRSSA